MFYPNTALLMGPNNALQLTAYSLRSFVAPAFGSS